MWNLTHRRATINDLPTIIAAYAEGSVKDSYEEVPQSMATMHVAYKEAFDKIDQNPDHLLMVIEDNGKVIATCHLVFIPNILFLATPRLLVEAVHVSSLYRGLGVGQWMFEKIEECGKTRWGNNRTFIIELTSNVARERAHTFYQRLGYSPSHVGFKKWIATDQHPIASSQEAGVL